MADAPFDVVLFDLDGTLTDPRVGITGSYRHALASVGVTVEDTDDLTWMIGPPLRANLVAAGLTGKAVDVAAEAYRRRHWSVGLYQATVIPGMAELVADLRSAGVRLGVATGKATAQAEATLEHFGLAHRFEAVAGADPDRGRVDKVDIVVEALRALGPPPPGRVAMVGDRRFDIEGGRAAGLVTVAVTWGHAPPGELAAAAPDVVVRTVAELRTALLA